MNRAAPAIILIATVKLRVIELTHQNLQLHHPALLVRIQILGQTLLADEEVAPRAAQEAFLARRWLNFPGACMRREPESQLCVAFQKVRLSTHRHHLTRSHLIMPLALPQLPHLKIDSLCPEEHCVTRSRPLFTLPRFPQERGRELGRMDLALKHAGAHTFLLCRGN